MKLMLALLMAISITLIIFISSEYSLAHSTEGDSDTNDEILLL